MVRVLPVHHFTSQHVHMVDEPVAVAIVPPDRMLVALANHSVQVRNLSYEGHIQFSFPTVDKVQQIVYCTTGDYVATIEAKPGRQKKVSLHARVYLNWDSEEACNAGTVVVRARIAGMVTPSSQQCNAPGVIEMVELPIKRTPTAIACSQLSGTVLIACSKSLVMYHYCTRTHNISRHKFFDFTECRFSLELSFAPSSIEMCEDVIACMNANHVQLFKLADEELEGQTPQMSTASSADVTNDAANDAAKQTHTAHTTTAAQPDKCKDYIDWEAVLQSKQPSPKFDSVLNPQSHPVLMDLPSVESQHVSEAIGHLQQSPFASAATAMPVNVKSGSPATMWTQQGVRIAQLLQLRVNCVSPSGGAASKDVGEEFKCLVLKPYYVRHTTSPAPSDTARNPLWSTSYSSFVGVVCLVTTQQEGYFYFFPMTAGDTTAPEYTDYDLHGQQSACICVYPFTAPVTAVVLESSLLHALTETGLETYTTRSGHFLITHLEKPDNKRKACPSASDPVFLVGLRPFLGCSSNVKHLVLSRSHLVLLAFPETPQKRSGSHNSSWTLYSLSLPAPPMLYADFLSNALKHRWTSPATYCHLLSEGHVMLRTLLALNDKQTQIELLQEQYKESCALLADYFLSGSEVESWVKAAPYYHMSGLTPLDVLARLNKAQSSQQEGEQELPCYIPGLLHYLRACLLQMNNAAEDVLFTPAVPALLNHLLDLVEVNAPAQLSDLVLRSQVLRECATDRVLALMKLQLRAKPYPEPADALSLALLCIQKDFPDQAIAVLSSIPTVDLTALLTEHSGLVLEVAKDKRKSRQPLAMTELAIVLIDYGPTALSQVLFNVVVAGTFTLQHVLQVFLELLPRMSTAGPVLQIFLEHYFTWYFRAQHNREKYESPVAEALKMLVRSYLSDLQATQHAQASGNSSDTSIDSVGSNTPRPKVLFEGCRPSFLSMLEGTSVSLSPARVSPGVEKRPQPFSLSLVKLQSLLSSGKLPPECLSETHQFVKSHPWTRGYLSLLVLCLPTRPASGVILDLCPEAILRFCQDKLESNDDWQWIINKLQQKIKSMEDDNCLKETCIQILTAMLTYLSQNLPLESLMGLLPPGEQSMQSYIRTCQEMSHATHINALLSATGQQLLSTLNL